MTFNVTAEQLDYNIIELYIKGERITFARVIQQDNKVRYLTSKNNSNIIYTPEAVVALINDSEDISIMLKKRMSDIDINDCTIFPSCMMTISKTTDRYTDEIVLTNRNGSVSWYVPPAVTRLIPFANNVGLYARHSSKLSYEELIASRDKFDDYTLTITAKTIDTISI